MSNPFRHYSRLDLLAVLALGLGLSALLSGPDGAILPALLAACSLAVLLARWHARRCAARLGEAAEARLHDTDQGATTSPPHWYAHVAAGARASACAPVSPMLGKNVAAFQQECSELVLDAEAARVQSEHCEGGSAVLAQAGNTLAGACDVLARRAGLAQSRTLMTECAAQQAAQALRSAIECASRLRQHLRAGDGEHEVVLALGARAEQSLVEAERAIAVVLERGGEASSAAADLAGSAERGGRLAQEISEACLALAPALQEGARCAARLSARAAKLDNGAGRLQRMLEASAVSQGTRPPAARASAAAAASAQPETTTPSRLARSDGNVLWVRFQQTGPAAPNSQRR